LKRESAGKDNEGEARDTDLVYTCDDAFYDLAFKRTVHDGLVDDVERGHTGARLDRALADGLYTDDRDDVSIATCTCALDVRVQLRVQKGGCRRAEKGRMEVDRVCETFLFGETKRTRAISIVLLIEKQSRASTEIPFVAHGTLPTPSRNPTDKKKHLEARLGRGSRLNGAQVRTRKCLKGRKRGGAVRIVSCWACANTCLSNCRPPWLLRRILPPAASPGGRKGRHRSIWMPATEGIGEPDGSGR
jgi:hypothetical protein